MQHRLGGREALTTGSSRRLGGVGKHGCLHAILGALMPVLTRLPLQRSGNLPIPTTPSCWRRAGDKGPGPIVSSGDGLPQLSPLCLPENSLSLKQNNRGSQNKKARGGHVRAKGPALSGYVHSLSISTSMWLRVFSCSLRPPKCPRPHFLPLASMSSMNKMQGAFLQPQHKPPGPEMEVHTKSPLFREKKQEQALSSASCASLPHPWHTVLTTSPTPPQGCPTPRQGHIHLPLLTRPPQTSPRTPTLSR